MLSTLLCHSGNLSRRSRRGYQLKILLTASPWTQAVGFYGKTSSTLEDKLLMLDLFFEMSVVWSPRCLLPREY